MIDDNRSRVQWGTRGVRGICMSMLGSLALNSLDPLGLLAVCCRPMDVDACGIDIGCLGDHCQLRDVCVLGESSSPVGVNIDPDRAMDDGTPCSEASGEDIEACLIRNPHSNQPYGGMGRPGSNCQVTTAIRLGKCCLNSSWRPDLIAWVPNRICLEYGNESRNTGPPNVSPRDGQMGLPWWLPPIIGPVF
jgi:hypothetical protein